jgi:hypothetical protein
VAAGATRVAISSHFARDGNVAEVQAKEGAQETFVTLVGLLLGVASAAYLNASPAAQWAFFAALTVIHVAANYAAVRMLALRPLNRSRANVLVRAFLAEHAAAEAPAPRQVEVAAVSTRTDFAPPLEVAEAGGGVVTLPGPQAMTLLEPVLPVQYTAAMRRAATAATFGLVGFGGEVGAQGCVERLRIRLGCRLSELRLTSAAGPTAWVLMRVAAHEDGADEPAARGAARHAEHRPERGRDGALQRPDGVAACPAYMAAPWTVETAAALASLPTAADAVVVGLLPLCAGPCAGGCCRQGAPPPALGVAYGAAARGPTHLLGYFAALAAEAALLAPGRSPMMLPGADGAAAEAVRAGIAAALRHWPAWQASLAAAGWGHASSEAVVALAEEGDRWRVSAPALA